MSPDLLKAALAPVRGAVEPALRGALPEVVQPLVGHVLDFGGLAVLAVLLAGLGVAQHRLRAHAPAAASAARMLCGLVALALAAWVLRHPSDGFDGLFTRWDHLVLAACAGIGLEGAPPPVRKAALSVFSLIVLVQYAGGHAVAGIGAACLVGTVLVRGRLRDRPLTLAAVQAALFVAVYAWALALRPSARLGALQVQGLLAFAALRQASFLVEATRAQRSLLDWATYMTFYPGAYGIFGATEVYAEFSRRNLGDEPPPDPRLPARRIALGALQVCLALALPISIDDVLAAGGPLVGWPTAVAFFVRTALGVMGGWALIEGVGLFYGVRLRANFRGLLTCQNPSELWWAWRGTLTNWLVQHVYVPLGARRHAVRNITIVFTVSFLWHALAVPFVTRDFALLQLVPIALWASINGIAVMLRILLPPTPDGGLPGRVVRTVLMWALGALTPILLHFQGAAFARFPELFPALLGVGR